MNLVNVPHLHLLLNHVPTVGTVIGLGLFLLSLVRRNDHLKRASLEVFFVIALLTLPVYLSGVAAEEVIEGRPEVSEASIEAHQDAALSAFVLMEITGAVAWLGLWQFRRISRPAGWTSSTVLLLSVVTVALMARAATLGGEIRHPEIVVGGEATAVEGSDGAGTGWFTNASIEEFVTGYPTVWPAAETLHFIGLCLVFGVLLTVNLRLLGVMKSVPFAALHRLLPWGILGFGVNLVTGMLFFIGASSQYTENVAFYWKIGFMMLAGANFLYLTVFDKAWALESGDTAALTEKVVAAASIGLWVGVIYWGRMLPFIGNAF